MPNRRKFESINEGKESFESVYNRPEPRGYYRTLSGLDYIIPGVAKPVFQAVAKALRKTRNTVHTKIVDLGCSYGVNAALLKHDCELDELYVHFASSPDLSVAEALDEDSEFIAELPANENLEIVGIDIADNAIEYAKEIELLDDGLAIDLESQTLTRAEAETVAGTDLIISTGCVGYVTDRTFSRLIPVATDKAPPWVASFVLRMFPYKDIEETLDRSAGLATERLDGYAFPQRRFANAQERDHVVAEIRRIGRDPAQELEHDCYFAEFYLSRPPEEIERMPLAEMMETFADNLIQRSDLPLEPTITPV